MNLGSSSSLYSAYSLQANESNTTRSLRESMVRLSSGLRSNISSDDSAGITLSGALEALGRGNSTAVDNTTNALQASNALADIGTDLQRLSSLATVAGSTQSGASGLTKEFESVLKSIDKTAESYGLTATGRNSNAAADTKSLGLTSDTGFDLSTADGVKAAQAAVDGAQEKLRSASSAMNATVENVATASTAAIVAANQTSLRSEISDATSAMQVATLTREQILKQAGTAILSQANSNVQNVMTLLRGA